LDSPLLGFDDEDASELLPESDFVALVAEPSGFALAPAPSLLADSALEDGLEPAFDSLFESVFDSLVESPPELLAVAPDVRCAFFP
jgi:hypothetical protein